MQLLLFRRCVLGYQIEETDEEDEENEDIPDYGNAEDSSDDDVEYTDQERRATYFHFCQINISLHVHAYNASHFLSLNSGNMVQNG